MNIQCTSVRLDQFTYLGIISSVSIPVPSGSFLLWASDTLHFHTFTRLGYIHSQVRPVRSLTNDILEDFQSAGPRCDSSSAPASCYLLVKGFGPGASHGGGLRWSAIPAYPSPHIMGSVNWYRPVQGKQTNKSSTICLQFGSRFSLRLGPTWFEEKNVCGFVLVVV